MVIGRGGERCEETFGRLCDAKVWYTQRKSGVWSMNRVRLLRFLYGAMAERACLTIQADLRSHRFLNYPASTILEFVSYRLIRLVVTVIQVLKDDCLYGSCGMHDASGLCI